MLYPDAVMHCIGIFRAIICIFSPPNKNRAAAEATALFSVPKD